jgi:hypothetical protein
VSDPQELIGAYLEGYYERGDGDHCAQLLLQSMRDLGYEMVQRYCPLRGETDEPLETHCGVCGAVKGEDCRNVSPKSPPLNRRFHLERETAGMHPRRNG